MFVNGIADAVILLPALLGLLFGVLILAAVLVNRQYPPFGWLVPIIATTLIFGWYEHDRNGSTNPVSKGIVEFGISSTIDDVLAQSTFKFPQPAGGFNQTLFTGDVVDIRFQTGNGVVQFPKVGGLSNSLLIINFRDSPSRVSYARFGAQHTPLTLDEALARAKQIESQLLHAGFVLRERQTYCRKFQPIEATLPDRIHPLKTWVEAGEALNDTRLGITEMVLFCLTGKTATVSLKVENWARGHSSIYAHNFGREWGITVAIER